MRWGGSGQTIVALPPGESLQVGETVAFALSDARGGQPPAHVKSGDSVLFRHTDVTDVGRINPASGQHLVELS